MARNPLLTSVRRLSRRQALLVAGLTAAIGIIVVIKIFAAGSFTAFEPESGTLTSPAAVVSDAGASGGQAVKFATGATPTPTPPAACASGGNYLWANLETCGWPGPTNTGYVLSQCGGVLTTSALAKDAQGIIHVTTANTTISCQSITGCIEVQTTGRDDQKQLDQPPATASIFAAALMAQGR